MAQDSTSRKLDQYIVRFPDGLRDRIKSIAASNNRSMNAEIVATLEQKYPIPKININVQLTTITEWMEYIDRGGPEDEFDDRLHEINQILALSSATKHLQFNILMNSESDNPQAELILRANWPDS